MPVLELEEIKSIAALHNLNVVAACDVAQLEDESERLRLWQDSGYAAGMEYMKRDAALLTSPLRLMENAKSVMVFTINYDRGPAPEMQTGFGRVARYAWGRDYHRVLKSAMKRFLRALEERTGAAIACRTFSDAVPLLERALARKAGLGFTGKNTMLIQPGNGSFFFIAEIISDLEIRRSGLAVYAGDCGSCSRCVSACPTGAIVSEYKLDAGRCISYLTIEKKGALSVREREALGEWIFGCDICQEVCPFNHRPIKRQQGPDLSDFSGGRGNGGLLNLNDILGIRTRERFQNRFAGTPIMRAGRESMLRNASAVAANTVAVHVAPALLTALGEDSSALVRQHALWAIFVLSRKGNVFPRPRLINILERALDDSEGAVKEEAECLLKTV